MSGFFVCCGNKFGRAVYMYIYLLYEKANHSGAYAKHTQKTCRITT